MLEMLDQVAQKILALRVDIERIQGEIELIQSPELQLYFQTQKAGRSIGMPAGILESFLKAIGDYKRLELEKLEYQAEQVYLTLTGQPMPKSLPNS